MSENEMNHVMTWDRLLSERRARESRSRRNKIYDGRNAFEKDYHRIILSASFRRLQDKTQVFPLDQSDFVRTRLTHSIEVSSLAKSLGEQTAAELRRRGISGAPNELQQKLSADLLLCAGLLHDIGNPPFGHYGETTMRDWYKNHLDTLLFKDKPLGAWLSDRQKADLCNFEGNAQALRLVSKLHYLVDEHGMNLSFGLLNTLMKYPVNSLMIDRKSEDTRYHKMGYFETEEGLFEAITRETGTVREEKRPRTFTEVEEEEHLKQLSFSPDSGMKWVARHPLTYLLEAADDISYRTADIEDASRKGKITFAQLMNALEKNERPGRSGDETLQADFARLKAALGDRLKMAKEKNIQNPELYAIQNWVIYVQTELIRSAVDTYVAHYDEIMRGEYLYDLFKDNLAGLVLDVLGDIAYDYVFSSLSIVRLEVAADSIIGGLMDKFVPACLYYDTEIPQKPVDRRLVALISDNYRACYRRESAGKSEGERLYMRLLLVNDYISGMTDSFARDLYHKFNGIY